MGKEPPMPGAIFNFQTALANSGDDKEFFSELVAMFCEDAPEELRALRAEIALGNAERSRFHAHTLKGMSGNIGGEILQIIARETEEALRAGDLPAATGRLTELEEALARLVDALRSAAGGTPA